MVVSSKCLVTKNIEVSISKFQFLGIRIKEFYFLSTLTDNNQIRPIFILYLFFEVNIIVGIFFIFVFGEREIESFDDN